MNKLISGLLSLSTLALTIAAPLSANAMPLQTNGGTLVAGWGHGRPHQNRPFHPFRDSWFHDRPYNEINQTYFLFCRRHRNDEWQRFGTYNRRSQARRAEVDYQERGYHCYVSSHDYGFR
jgi:hypothetical protein